MESPPILTAARAGSLFADDVQPGSTVELGTWEITVDEILEFGRLWDPMSFHVDETLALQTPIGGLAASGVQTIAICQRLTAEAVWSRFVSAIGRSLSDVRWYVPVRPGDRLTGSFHVLDIRSRAGKRARLAYRSRFRNQHGDLTFEMSGETVIPCR